MVVKFVGKEDVYDRRYKGEFYRQRHECQTAQGAFTLSSLPKTAKHGAIQSQSRNQNDKEEYRDGIMEYNLNIASIYPTLLEEDVFWIYMI
jgi:hypothetical protein